MTLRELLAAVVANQEMELDRDVTVQVPISDPDNIDPAEFDEPKAIEKIECRNGEIVLCTVAAEE